MRNLIVLLMIVLSVCAFAQDQSGSKWWLNYSGDYWLVKQAGYTATTWDSVTSADCWSEPFKTWDYMSVLTRVILDSVRFKVEYWAGIDTTRSAMVFGRTLEWDKAANLDSTYLSSKGYWNSNITASAIPAHAWGRLKIVPGGSGNRVINAAGLFSIYISGRK